LRHTSDYLHLVDNSAKVNVGDNVDIEHYLADIGKTGTYLSHLHFAVTNLGEGNKYKGGKFVTIPAPLYNYEVSHDKGKTWSLVVKGIPTKGQWVRKPFPQPPSYSSQAYMFAYLKKLGPFIVYGWLLISGGLLFPPSFPCYTCGARDWSVFLISIGAIVLGAVGLVNEFRNFIQKRKMNITGEQMR
jgi:hypothetical protein